jgi:hypothetical protein
MPSKKAWFERPNGLIKKEGGGANELKERFAELLSESRECFDRLNICNLSKSLQDSISNSKHYKYKRI